MQLQLNEYNQASARKACRHFINFVGLPSKDGDILRLPIFRQGHQNTAYSLRRL